jgi:hypothetical protein
MAAYEFACHSVLRQKNASVPEKIKMRVIILAAFGVLLSFTPSLAQGALEPISPVTYQRLTCPQIVQEGRSISRKGFALSGLRPGTGGSNVTATNSAIVIVWPAPLNASAEKMANLRYADTQMDALEQASIASQCSIQFQRPPKS